MGVWFEIMTSLIIILSVMFASLAFVVTQRFTPGLASKQRLTLKALIGVLSASSAGVGILVIYTASKSSLLPYPFSCIFMAVGVLMTVVASWIAVFSLM